MINTEIKAKIEDVKAELTVLQKQLEGKKLRLKVGIVTGDLVILYGNQQVGWITTFGNCYILSTPDRQEVIEQWMEDGMPTDDSIVEWRGGLYQIEYDSLRRIDIDIGGYIYSFSHCRPCCACEDPNIKRYSNGTPKIY